MPCLFGIYVLANLPSFLGIIGFNWRIGVLGGIGIEELRGILEFMCMAGHKAGSIVLRFVFVLFLFSLTCYIPIFMHVEYRHCFCHFSHTFA